MSTRTKEEELALDEKIARIQRKNEEILRRQKEIEEDKRLAEQQNAIVKLRPMTTNVSRERTPALKPSNRELRHEITEDFPLQEPPQMPRSSRGSFRARGGDRFRGQGDWKSSGGPPPDPKSFLYDDERDIPSKDNLNSEQKREPERGRREERDNRDNFRGGGREFQRGWRRGGTEYRGERGRRGGGGRRNEEEEWRAERMKIDEARIQRQRAADGKWRREWDNDKLLQEQPEEPRQEARKLNSPQQEKWSPPSQYRGQFLTSPDRSMRQPSRGGVLPRGARGRGRLDPAELQMPLEKFQIEALSSQTSPTQLTSVLPIEDNFSIRHSGGDVASPPSPHPPVEDFKLDPTRSVACVGNTFKISIPNMGAAKSTPKPQRQAHETRGRVRSQTSYSSQSDDDSPRDRSYRGGRRQRAQKATKGQDKKRFEHRNPASDDTFANANMEPLPAQNKPPLPPFRSEQKPSTELNERVETKDGDESWEDVTTSGTESMTEDLSSVHSSPLRKTVMNTMVISGKQIEAVDTGPIQSLEFSQNQPFDEDIKKGFEDYLKQFELNEGQKSVEGSANLGEPEQQYQINTSETSSFNISLDTSDNILLNESVTYEISNQEKSPLMTTLPYNAEFLESKGSQDDFLKENITSECEDTLKLAKEEKKNSAEEILIDLTSSLTSNNQGVGHERDTIVEVEVECKGKEMSEQNNTSDDPSSVSEPIQNFFEDKDILANSSMISGSCKTTSEVKADEKNQNQK